VQTKNRGQGT